MGEASSPIDVLDFQFKLHCRLKVFENDSHNTFSKACNLVTIASRYGLLFVGTSQPRFQVIEIQSIQNYTVKDGDVKNYKRRYIPLPSIPQHLLVNCDSTKLCVILVKDGCTKAIIYDVPSFLKQQLLIVQEIQLSATPGVTVVDLCWNPTIPTILTVCKDDGSLGLYEFKGPGFEVHELPASTGASCLCWSPKGKQIVVGTKDGKLTQFKPDLTMAKSIIGPSLPNNPHAISLQWISNYQFIAVYKIDGPEPQFNLCVVDAPKGGTINFSNYDDVCYSYGTSRPPQFYMLQQPTWNILLVASSNSTEVGVLGLEKDRWNQWILNDSARAELPLSATKQDTLPVGLAFDTSSTQQLPWGESTLPPAPILLLLSHHGVLCCFDAVNLKPGIQQICSPPEPLPDKSGLSAFTYVDDSVPPPSIPATVVKPTAMSQQLQQPPQQPSQQPLQQPPQQPPQQFPIFGPKPTMVSAPQTTYPPPSVAMPHVMTAYQPMFNTKPPMDSMQPPFSMGGSSLQPTTQPIAPSQPFSNPIKHFYGVQNMLQKPEVSVPVSGCKEPKLELPKPIMTQATQEIKPAVQQPKMPTPAVATPPKAGITGINEETEALMAHIIAEECSMIDIEVTMVVQQGSSIKVDVGSDKEATSIVESTAAMQDFLNEMNEISNSQVAEVHALKQNLIQTWAWYEEARSRFATYKDPTLRTLILAQPLDAASERRLDEIRRLIYYLDSELTQANAALDDQWETFQDSCKKRFSIKIPNIEAIYQAMVKQNATLQKQVYILKDISMRIRAKMRNVSAPRLLVSLQNTAELEEQLKSLHVEPKDLLQVRHERVLKRQKRVTKTRAEKLKATFLNGNVLHVTVNKPQMNSALHMSGLGGVPFSPIAPNRKIVPQKLDFVQSTPLPQDVTVPSRIPVTKSPVATSLFTDGKSTMPSFACGDVKTSAFVPMNALKPNTFGSQQKAYSFVAPQVTAPQILKPVTQASSVFSSLPEVVTKPSMFSSAPPTAISTAGLDASKSTTPSLIPSKPTQKSLFDNVPAFKPSGFTVPSGVSVSIVKVEPTSTTTEEVPKTPTSIKAPVFSGPPANIMDAKLSFVAPIAKTTGSAFGSSSFPNFISSGSAESITSTSITSGTTNLPTSTAKMGLFTSGTSALFGQSAGNLSFTQPTARSADVDKVSIKPLATIAGTLSPEVVFGQSAAPTATPATSIPSTLKVSSSLFGQADTTSPSTIFGKTDNTSSSASVVFGEKSSENSEASIGSMFGQSNTPAETSTSTQPPIPASAASGNSSIFGQAKSGTSIFGGTSTLFGQPGAASIFAKAASAFGQSTPGSPPTVETTNTPLAATTSSSIFGQTGTGTAPPFAIPTEVPTLFAPTTVPSVPQTTTASSIFGQSVSSAGTPLPQPASTPSLIFRHTATTTQPLTPTTTTGSSVFAQSSTASSSPFSATTQSSIIGSSGTATSQPQATTTSSVFGQPDTTDTAPSTQQTTTTPSQATTTATPFLQTTQTTSSAIFGQGGPATTTAFSQAATTSTSVFGQSVSTSSVFGQPPSAAAAPFGQRNDTPTPFGQNASTSASSVFGQTTIFGKAATAFGQPASTSASNAPAFVVAFGQPTSTTSSVFGQPASSAASVFGQPASSTAPVFGQSAGFGSNSIFNTATTKSSSIFGGSSPFGATPTSSAFGSSPFGGAAPATSTAPFSGGSVFGSPATSSMPFGSTNTFGTTSASNASGFAVSKPTFGGGAFGASDNPLNFSALSTGTPTTTSSGGFGSGFNQYRNANQEQPNAFGGGSVFGAPAQTSTASVFGGSSPFSKPAPAFGAPPAFGATGSFGQQPAFGQTAFGSTGGNAFGSPSQPGPFSGGSQSVSQSGFGAGTTFQKPAGFGSPPAFGSPSAGFGAPPSFGSPAFGGAPGFGSPNKVFGGGGGGAGEPSFGVAPTQQQNSTFANLATQPTVGFGNLAQQSPPQTSQQSFSGGSSFSTWR